MRSRLGLYGAAAARGITRPAPQTQLTSDRKVPNAEVAREIESIAMSLQRLAQTAAERDLIARYYGFRGALDQALEWERRAMEADPSCIDCLRAAAEFALQKGHLNDALRLARLAMALVREGTGSPSLSAQIARYVREVKRSNVSAPRPIATAPAAAGSSNSSKPEPQRTRVKP